jgi:hypothetical protein
MPASGRTAPEKRGLTMLRFFIAAGLLGTAGYLLYLIFAFRHAGIGLTIMLALLIAGLCTAFAVLLLKRDEWHPDDDWWDTQIDKDSMDDDL